VIGRDFMPLTSSKDQNKQAAPPPREIVVYCEGFGAGPGCGWFVEVSFVEWNHGGFSVFLRTDEDAFGDGYPVEDTLEQDGTDDPERARRVSRPSRNLSPGGAFCRCFVA
jgi:hypothetical protein